MPTSVLLAVLAAAGLLALAPALVRRYDATERLAAERASSTARVLQRRRRRRTVPGRRPINPGRQVTVTVPAPTGDAAGRPQRRLRLVTGRRPVRRPPPRRHTPAVVRRRRVVEKLGFREEAYHQRYMHIDGGWRDHLGYAMTSEEIAAEGGLLSRWKRIRTSK